MLRSMISRANCGQASLSTQIGTLTVVGVGEDDSDKISTSSIGDRQILVAVVRPDGTSTKPWAQGRQFVTMVVEGPNQDFAHDLAHKGIL